MKDFVLTKKFDKLGRIVIPVEMRRHYSFKMGEKAYIIPQKNGILISPINEKKKS